MEQKSYTYIVQVTRQLSVDIVNCFVKNGQKVELLTGTVEYNYQAPDERVVIKKFNRYDQSSFFKRTWSGMIFTIRCFFYLLFKNKKNELILVSTPPFVFYMGWILKKLRGRKYHLIVWDLYPDVLVNMNVMKKEHPLIRLWEKMNLNCFKNAESIFTLGDPLAEAIRNYGNVGSVIVPNWVDSSFIRPVERSENKFAIEHQLTDKLVVMYSGNLGLTHDVESIVYTARELRSEDNIKFVIIGEGSKSQMIRDYVHDNGLSNVLLLPYQDRSVLPYSLTAADISIVTLSKGAESVSVPSKTYYSLAAGSAIFALASKRSELGTLIDRYGCGYVFDQSSPDVIAGEILQLKNNPSRLHELKENARLASADFTPANALLYFQRITKNELS